MDEEGELGYLFIFFFLGFVDFVIIFEKEVDEVLVLLSLWKSYFGGK